MNVVNIDITIIGGGIAGLWTLNRLRQLGYQAILIENNDLGGNQTCASQGIIHGGTKYALKGILTDSAKAISAMPSRWLACLSGHGEINLTDVETLALHQFLWTENDIATKLTGFFASKVMQSKMALIDKNHQPDFFKQQNQSHLFKGNVYQLNEPVLNTQQLVKSLSRLQLDAIIKSDIKNIEQTEQKAYKLQLDHLNIHTKQLLLTAGNGNQDLYQKIFPLSEKPVMQQRPLQMLMLKGSQLQPIYAHRLGVSALPTLTISSHFIHGSDETIWYIGGELAENYATKSQGELIATAKEQLKKLIPWQSFEQVQWSSVYINRAEPIMNLGQRPDNQFLSAQDNVILAWPVKLALTPLLADEICAQIETTNLSKTHTAIPEEISRITKPDICQMPWEKVTDWSE